MEPSCQTCTRSLLRKALKSLPLKATAPPSLQARAIAPPSWAASRGLCRNLPRALSLLLKYHRAIRAIPVRGSPCSTRSTAPLPGSARPSGSRSTRWQATSASRTPLCVRPFMRAAFSPLASPRQWSRSTPSLRPRRFSTSSPRRASPVSAPLPQCSWPCACGYRRPVVESHSARLLSCGAGQVRYPGLPGAVVQQGMTLMTHNGVTLVRSHQDHLSPRAQKCRRLLRLKRHKANEFKDSKN